MIPGHFSVNLKLMSNLNKQPIVVGLIGLGCPKNVVDSERMLADIAQAGFAIAADPADSDVVIINTCGFIAPAKEEAFEAIAETLGWKKAGPVRKVIVAGCLAQRMGSEIFEEFPDIDAVVGLGSRDEIVSIIKKTLKSKKPKSYLAHHDDHISDDRIRLITGHRHWAYLRISEGCDHACSFCTIPSIRGPFRSKSQSQILAEARELADSGVVELNIIAQDTTSYGRDLGIKNGLARLLTDLDSINLLTWIRLMYLYPVGVTDQLIDTIANSERIINYLDMPIQHINDDILKAMRRPDNKKLICSLIEKLRLRIPDIVLRTTVIVGFPGETDSHFEELLDFVREVRFDALGGFKYYAEEGTAAAKMQGQIPEKVKDQRIDELMLTQQRIAFEINQRRVGSELTCLIDSFEPDGSTVARFYGQAPEIDSVCIVDRCFDQPGELIKAKVTKTSDYDLIVEKV